MWKTSEIDIAIIEILPGNIFNVTVKKGSEVQLEDAKRLIRVTNEMLDYSIPFRGGVYDISQITYIDEEAREYLANGKDIEGTVVAAALISHSYLGKIIGNLFLTLTDNRAYPIKYFDSPIRAEHWVRSKMREALASNPVKKVA